MDPEKDVKKEVTEESEAAKKVSAESGDKKDVAGDNPELDELNSQIAAEDAKFAEEDEAAKKAEKDDLEGADKDAGSEVLKEKDDKEEKEGKKESEDSIDPQLLKDVYSEKDKKQNTEQTKDQKIQELQRKVEKLAKKQESAIDGDSAAPPPPLTEKELAVAFETDYPEGDIPGAQLVAMMKFLDDHYKHRVLPAWQNMQTEERKKLGHKDKIKSHPYYGIVKDELNRLVEEDPIISKLPEDQKWTAAMDRSLAGAVPELLKRQAMKTKKQTEDGKKLILRDKPAGDISVKGKKSDMVLTKDDKLLQKTMTLSEEDLVNEQYEEGKTIIED